MVKFLSEHALALEEKLDDLPDPWPATRNDIGREGIHFERSRVTQSMITDMQRSEQYQ